MASEDLDEEYPRDVLDDLDVLCGECGEPLDDCECDDDPALFDEGGESG